MGDGPSPVRKARPFSQWEGWRLSRFYDYFSSRALVGRGFCFGFCRGSWCLWRGRLEPLSLCCSWSLGREVGGGSGGAPHPPNPPTLCGSGGGEGWRERWGRGGGLAQSRAEWLPDPQTDGSNFRSRGAGLNCCPKRQGPMSVSRKQPQSHTFGPDAALVFVYLTMPEPGAECF